MKISTENLVKRYRNRNVVDGISLEVEQGEVVGLLGPNGAGKTTTFYMVVGLVKPNSGCVRMDNQDITRLPMYKRARAGISYLPQEASVFRNLTVEENIHLVLQMMPMTNEQRKSRAEELLEDLGIKHKRHDLGRTLSGGERRRVEIARALATNPRFVLLDEPFAGVDPIAVIEIQRIVRFLKERGIGVLITDHNVRETLGICDRAYIINQGAVLASGHPEDIINNESVRRVYLGDHFRM